MVCPERVGGEVFDDDGPGGYDSGGTGRHIRADGEILDRAHVRFGHFRRSSQMQALSVRSEQENGSECALASLPLCRAHQAGEHGSQRRAAEGKLQRRLLIGNEQVETHGLRVKTLALPDSLRAAWWHVSPIGVNGRDNRRDGASFVNGHPKAQASAVFGPLASRTDQPKHRGGRISHRTRKPSGAKAQRGAACLE